MKLKTISLLTCGMIASLTDASAQQVMATSDFLRGGTVTLEGAANATVSNLTDGNDRTCFVAQGVTTASLLFDFDRVCLIKGINVIAGSSLNKVPSRMTLYGRVDESSEWTAIGRFNIVTFDEPYTAFTAKTLSTAKAFRQYKLDIQKIKSGDELEIAEIQVLGQWSDNTSIATADNGEFTASGNVQDLWAAGAGNGNSMVTFKNAKAEYGVENTWLEYTFNTPSVVDAYSMITGEGALGASRPVTWEILASNDGNDWVTLDMRNNEDAFEVDNYEIRRTLGKSDLQIDFAAVADELHEVLYKNFYRDHGIGKYYIHAWNPDPSLENLGFNYWWMAHAIDTNIDAYIRTGEMKYQTRARQIHDGMYDGGSLWNTFYDDMEWMNLACIRGYQNLTIGRDNWLDDARQLYDWIWTGWNYDDGTEGGIRWNSSDTGKGKNSCSNGPALVGAGKLYQITQDESYLEKAKMIYEWMLTHSRFDDGFIKDGPNNEIRGWAFTYNQGTWVGGLLELYRITGEQKYYDVAVDLLDKTIDSRWYSPEGIMREQGSSDGGLFKGIYIRYITDWILSGYLDDERRYRYAQFIAENARSMYNCALHKPGMMVMPNWKDRADKVNGENNGGTEGSYHASIALSGIILCESMDRMRREGVLNDDYSVKNPNVGKPFSHYRLKVTANGGDSNVRFGGFSLYGQEGQTAIGTVGMDAPQMSVESAAGGIIVSCDDRAVVEVFALDGRQVRSGHLAGEMIACQPGVYVVRVSLDGVKSVNKVVVK